MVLSFDDYQRVPAAKAITQANRVKKKAEYEFGEGQQLPSMVPDKYNEKLSNRIFKRRVIDMVCNRVMEHLSISASDTYARSFVVDYTGCPILFKAEKGASKFDARQPTFMVNVPPMGEADIKFTRWLNYFQGDMVSFSVDGDFIPIALMHHERSLLLQGSGAETRPRNIAIYRLRYRMTPVPRIAKTAAAAAGTLQQQQDAQPRVQQKHPPREYEYVSIPALYCGMRDAFDRLDRSTSAADAAASKGGARSTLRMHYMRLLAVLIGLGGTDFSRGLPLVGPCTLWDMLSTPTVFSNLQQLYSTRRGLVRVSLACNALACNIYTLKFSSHFKKGGAKGTTSMDSYVVRTKPGSSGASLEDGGGDDVDSDCESFAGGYQVLFVFLVGIACMYIGLLGSMHVLFGGT